MNKLMRIPLGLVLVLASGLAQAELVADAEAGKAKSATCVACHGPDGAGTTPENPNLAGQVAGYIADQLAKFKSGERQNAIMNGMAAGLSEQDMADLDVYYSSLPAIPGSIAEDEAEAARRAAGLYRGGDQARQIASCMACHGPSGRGILTRFPGVAGQKQEYMVAQLQAFKSGARQSDAGIMNSISFLLSEQEMKDLAAYMHALQ